jgi:hypothetical protein
MRSLTDSELDAVSGGVPNLAINATTINGAAITVGGTASVGPAVASGGAAGVATGFVELATLTPPATASVILTLA